MMHSAFRNVYSEDPLLVYIKDPWEFPWKRDNRPKGIIAGFTWNNQYKHDAMLRWAQRMQSDTFKIVILCDTLDIMFHFQENGVPACYVNENCFHDETIFTIQDIPKKFDLIYVAAATGWKNLHLLNEACSGLSVAWACGRISDQKLFDTVNRYANVKMFFKIDRHELCHLMNQSRVGLCLSTQEGSMRAACEYRLCGLPVVNVQTNGGTYSPRSCGREVLLGDRSVFTAKSASVNHVRNAISYAIDSCDNMSDRTLIRSEYLHDREGHRVRFSRDVLVPMAEHLRIDVNAVLSKPVHHFNLEWGSVDKFL